MCQLANSQIFKMQGFVYVGFVELRYCTVILSYTVANQFFLRINNRV